MLFTPSLLFLFPTLDPAFPRLDVNQAISLGLIVEFVGYSSAASGYWRQRRVAFDVASPLLLVTVPTAVLFSLVGSAVPARWLLLAFGLILFGLSFLFIRFHRANNAPGAPTTTATGPKDGEIKRLVDRDGREYRYAFHYGLTDLFGSAFGGAFVGLTGISLGETITTLLALRHPIPLHVATATSVFVVAVTVLSAAATHVYLVFQQETALPWNLAAVMVLAVLIGGQIAPLLAGRLPEKVLRGALIAIFLFIGLIMVLRAAFM